MAPESKRTVDKIRASRDGHEFHEAWAARRVLELLLPKDDLFGIAVEGTSPSDRKKADLDTLEVADLTLYYGGSIQFDAARAIQIIQFKYSIGKEFTPYSLSDARKTLQKFSKSFKNYINQYGIEKTSQKISFEIVTNRPILSDFLKAVEMLRSGGNNSASKKLQSLVTQIRSVTKLNIRQLKLFAERLEITGSAGTLNENKVNVHKKITSWSVQYGDARARLGDLRDLVRRKAGSAGDNNNVILKEDLIETLGLSDETDLLPCPESFPIVEHVFPREQLDDVLRTINGLKTPLVIHAAGGVGKTVFLQTIASKLASENEVILFDCFGGGSYRAGDDKRHLPKRGMLHIVNKLACNGLCDLILPGSGDSEDIMSIARKRLTQATEAMQVTSPGKKLILFLDAIDNAAVAAEDEKENAFPKLLLESIHFKGAIPNLQVIASSRSHRVQRSIGQAKYVSFPLNPFSKEETATYLRSHNSKISKGEIEVAYSRSDGNARILEHLVKGRKELLQESEAKNKILLDEFLRKTINDAVNDSIIRGHSQEAINAFLAGLAVLPLPIPISEYARSHGMDIAEIESFASDLSPMLERTRYGLMFRDEPTETLIRDTYGESDHALKGLAENLFKQQSASDYAARALPGLLVKLNDAEGLVSLAFSHAFPSSITSKVGKQAIRHSRISAALTHSTNTKNYDDLVSLLVELSMIAAIDGRGADYILQNPELVVASNDVDSKRRLFEIKTSWQGTRHSRLAIAHLLSGELGDAYHHAGRSWRWIAHYFRKPEEERQRHRQGGPDEIDVAATPLCLIAQGNYKDAFGCIIGKWKDWFAYKVASYVFLILVWSNRFSLVKYNIDNLVAQLPNNISICAAALSNLELDSETKKKVLRKLGKASKASSDFLKDRIHDLGNRPAVVYSLIHAAGVSSVLKLNSETKEICSIIPHNRPGIWQFVQPYLHDGASDYVLVICLKRLAEGHLPNVVDLLPKEIHSLLPQSHLRDETNYRNELQEYILAHDKKQKEKHAEDKSNYYSYEERERSEKFLNHQLELLMELCQAFIRTIKSSKSGVEASIKDFIGLWMQKAKDRTGYGTDGAAFAGPLCKQFLFFTLHIRTDISTEIANDILALIDQGKINSVYDLTKLTAIFSSYDYLHEHAGKTAMKAAVRIENDSDVASRASDYAALASAIAQASPDEMTAFFRKGVEQVDMIGSGDYWFTNELLSFASAVKDEELENEDIHTLTNIAELNLSESEKFPWFAFGAGLARVAGTKVLSKIARWDDRGKVKFTYTLLPCLIALVKYKKLDAKYALTLIQLCDPSETWDWDYTTLVEEMFKQRLPDESKVLDEVLYKFEKDNPSTCPENQIKRLLPLINRIKGEKSDEALRWENILNISKEIRDEKNYRSNHRNKGLTKKETKPFEIRYKKLIEKVLKETRPTDLGQMIAVFKTFNEVDGFYNNSEALLLAKLRQRVKFAERGKYLEIVASLQGLRLHLKLQELKSCLSTWIGSSISLQGKLETLGKYLVANHISSIIHFDMSYVSTKEITEISDLTGAPARDLWFELFKSVKNGGYNVDAAIWMSIATMLAQEVEGKVSKAALVRLLRSESAQLSSTVLDGGYVAGLYLDQSQEDVVAALVWKQLGSVDSSERWRAAHSLKCLAKFQCWETIDILVRKFDSTTVPSFHAPELPFYFLHARLWLLVAMGRIAKEHPKEILRYRHVLEKIALSPEYPHVLMRHYASEALFYSLPFDLSPTDVKLKQRLQNINKPRFEFENEDLASDSGVNMKRPTSKPKPQPGFHIDMDFEKYHVDPLYTAFRRPHWEIEDLITIWVRKYDEKITSMYDQGGRDIRRHRSDEMDLRSHPYGYYLGWHAIHLAAGELLTMYPITDDSYSDDPWDSWIDEFKLTRNDGLWLSDGTDRYPLDTRLDLLETKKNDVVITGDRVKLLKILGINDTKKIGVELNIDADWNSSDGLSVYVMSAFVDSAKSFSLAKKLAKTKGFHAGLPSLEEYDNGEFDRHYREQSDFLPWIVNPTSAAQLDKEDPYGVANASSRPRLRQELVSKFELRRADAFGRCWVDKNSKVVMRAETWGHPAKFKNDYESNSRLIMSSKFLKQVLKVTGTELILLVNLQRYEESQRYDNRPSRFSNTTAVVLINKDLEFEYFRGPVNQVRKSRYENG
jgi:hypothetical protein